MHIADHDGQSTALILADGGMVAYGELYRRSRRVAALLHEAGLRRGDGVALVLPNCREFLEITWACQLSGLYYSAVNTHFTPEDVLYVIADSGSRAVFLDASMTATGQRVIAEAVNVDVRIAVGGDLPGWGRYDDAIDGAGEAPPHADGSEMLYSSGTTGRPKAVRRPLATDGSGSWAQKVLEQALTKRYGMTPDSVYLSPAPLYHAAGVNYTMAVQRAGAASVVMPRFDAEIRCRDGVAADPGSPGHPRAVRADDVRADAETARCSSAFL